MKNMNTRNSASAIKDKFVYNGQPLAEIPRSASHIIIEPSAIAIPSDTFRECAKIVQVEIHKNLKSIGSRAFQNCVSLERVLLPVLVKVIGRKAFHGCRLMTVVEMPNGLRVIENEAFQYCKSLQKVSIPSTVKRIGAYAFLGCVSLTELEIPPGIKRISEGTFVCCKSLRRISMPTTVEVIGEYAFGFCGALNNVHLHEGLRVISRGSFHHCHALTSMKIPSTVEIIGVWAFRSCTSLVNVQLPEGLKVIQTEAFSCCTSLESIAVPTTVEKIEEEAFDSCESLLDVDLPEGLRVIDRGAFQSCISLQAVRLPSTVERLGKNAFSDCLALVTVEITGASIKFESRAFADCIILSNIVISPTTNQTNNGEVFSGCVLLRQQYHYWNIQRGLKHRFRHCEINHYCYKATDATVEGFKEKVDSICNQNLLDDFGMTPFHVVASSAKPRIEIFQTIIDTYPSESLCWKDSQNKRPIDYLCGNGSRYVNTLIQMVLQETVLKDLRYLGFVQWRDDLAHLVDSVRTLCKPRDRQHRINEIYTRLALYSRLESIALIEEALWKMRIDSVTWHHFYFGLTRLLHYSNSIMMFHVCNSHIHVTSQVDFNCVLALSII